MTTFSNPAMDKEREMRERADISDWLKNASSEDVVDWIIDLKTIRDNQFLMIERLTKAVDNS